jgi:hypothetical protein
MKKILVLLGLALLMPAVASAQYCLQDQYGNQYNFTVDSEHKYLFGTVTSAQGCTIPVWPILGSYTTAPLVVEITAANPAGAGDNCVLAFKLKGNYPNFAWYYEFGYGDQEGTWTTCLTSPAASPSAGGMLKEP